MNRLIFLTLLVFLAAMLNAQEKEGDSKPADDDFPVIDETNLTFDGPVEQAAGGDQEDDLSERISGASITFGDYLRVLFFLIIVIVIVWLFVKILRRYSGNRFGDQDMINVMGSQSLTGETSLHVVEVENSYYLLGSSSGNVALITKITDQETIDALKLKRSSQYDRGGRSFFDLLTGLNGGALKPGEEAAEESVSFLKSRRDRLKDL